MFRWKCLKSHRWNLRKWKQDPGWVKKNEGDLDTRIRNMLNTWKVNTQGGTAGDHSPSPGRWWHGQRALQPAVIVTVWQEWKLYHSFCQEKRTCHHNFQRGGILKSAEGKKRKKGIKESFSFLSGMPLKRDISDTNPKQVKFTRIKFSMPAGCMLLLDLEQPFFFSFPLKRAWPIELASYW